MANENSMDDLFLVDCDFNWADEFDLAGHEILSRGELLSMKEDMEKLDRTCDYDYKYEIYFGTNENLTYSPSDVIDIIDKVLKQTPIAPEDAEVIDRVMGSCRAVISLSEIVERIWEEATDNGYDENEDAEVDVDDENLEEPTDETEDEDE